MVEYLFPIFIWYFAIYPHEVICLVFSIVSVSVSYSLKDKKILIEDSVELIENKPLVFLAVANTKQNCLFVDRNGYGM